MAKASKVQLTGRILLSALGAWLAGLWAIDNGNLLLWLIAILLFASTVKSLFRLIKSVLGHGKTAKA